MFIKSIKINQKLVKILAFALLAAVLALVLMRVMQMRTQDTLAVNNKEVETRKIKTNDDRVNFIRQFGWEVEPSAVEVVEVLVPRVFDEVYNTYNEMQKQQGLDLDKYKGKAAKRWSYRVLNYPGEPGEIQCNLLIVGTRVIAADICKTELGGFMHGMAMPKPSMATGDQAEGTAETAVPEAGQAEEAAVKGTTLPATVCTGNCCAKCTCGNCAQSG